MNDWFLLTLIPANFLSSGAERYILQSFVIIGLTILLFSLFLFSVYRFYHIHRKQLERLAFVDPLTGGPNNAAFQLKYTELAKTMAPDTYSILLVNVNGFKLINERLGIPTGNRILAYLYQVLERQLRPADDELIDHHRWYRLFRGLTDRIFTLCGPFRTRIRSSRCWWKRSRVVPLSSEEALSAWRWRKT